MTPETLTITALPAVPLTIEGASVLHQMMRFRRSAWRALGDSARQHILDEATAAFSAMEKHENGRQSALYSLLGHKGDLMFVHFRRNLEELSQAETALGKLEISGLGGSYGVERLTLYRMKPEMGPPETTSWEYPGADRSWELEFAAFEADIRLKRPPAPGLRDAWAALRIVDAIYRRTL